MNIEITIEKQIGDTLTVIAKPYERPYAKPFKLIVPNCWVLERELQRQMGFIEKIGFPHQGIVDYTDRLVMDYYTRDSKIVYNMWQGDTVLEYCFLTTVPIVSDREHDTRKLLIVKDNLTEMVDSDDEYWVQKTYARPMFQEYLVELLGKQQIIEHQRELAQEDSKTLNQKAKESIMNNEGIYEQTTVNTVGEEPLCKIVRVYADIRKKQEVIAKGVPYEKALEMAENTLEYTDAIVDDE